MTAVPQNLRVLLYSPVAGIDPLSGDTSYTAALLADPPPGVEYVTYDRAVADGTLTIRGRRPGMDRSFTAADAALLAARTIELLARRLGVAFREDTTFVQIDSTAFDVLHLHLFAVGQVGSNVPVVSSAGMPLWVLYRTRERWSRRRTQWAERLERVWATAVRAQVPWLQEAGPSTMIVYSAAAANALRRRRGGPADVRIVSTALPELAFPSLPRGGRRLLFVGRDFERKGGDVAVAAFDQLRSQGVACDLTVVTSRASLAHESELLAREDVDVQLDPERRELLDRILPSCDVLLAPTRADCGAPYGILEAMQARLAIVLSDSEWLDDRLVSPGVTRVDRTPGGVARAAAALMMDPDAMHRAQDAAHELWRREFSMAFLNAQLLDAYETAARR